MTVGRYCPACGQRKTEVLVSVRTMVGDVLEDQLVLNRALPRTLFALMLRPGFLTTEYIRGRIVSYIAPFRLYLVASVLFFLILSFFGLAALDRMNIDATLEADSAASADAREALRVRQEVLAEMDTAALPPAAAAAVRSSLTSVEASLGSIDTAAATDSSGATDLMRVDGEPLPPGTLQPWAASFENNTTNPVLREAINRKIAQVGHLPPREAFSQLLEDYVEYAPHMVFLLLPLFAFLLKILYVRRNRYYAEHFVFALHVHAFAFFVFILMFALPWDWIDMILFLWMVVYLWLAMRKVYGQGYIRTTVKWWVLGWSYMWVFTLGMVGLAFVTLLLT
ncbi:MAG: DUF3667 domain-containing protein [Longimicrobiales bacterium]